MTRPSFAEQASQFASTLTPDQARDFYTLIESLRVDAQRNLSSLVTSTGQAFSFLDQLTQAGER